MRTDAITDSLPLVTIAIPTYNRADGYLREALSSAVNQTYGNIEIIVSDNCSSDNTDSVVNGFGDPRIRYVRHQKNIGANNNFNYCLQESRGDYFLLLHDDDLIDPDFVETCMESINCRTDVGVIFTGNRVIDAEGKVFGETRNRVGGLPTELFFRGWFKYSTALYLCSTLFNTRRLREIGGFRSKHNLFQDVIAEVQLAARFGRVDIEDCKASFRKHPFEMTFAVKVKDWCEDSLMLLDLMCELVPDHRDIIRAEGMRFFATLNYNRAGAVKSFSGRMLTFWIVFRMFGYRHFPLKTHVRTLIYQLLSGTPIHSGVRYVKKLITPDGLK